MSYPWDSGNVELNWSGYFISGTSVLRNKIGADTVDALREAENDLVESRLIELREAPELVGDRTYDLSFLRRVHRQLFQDVYEWAGDVRTVGIEKGEVSFCPPRSIARPMDHVAAEVHAYRQLKQTPWYALPDKIAYVYDFVNFAHPFREGNGRATREFFDLLLSERGAGLNWQETDSEELHHACHVARASSDLRPMIEMFTTILDDEPAYDF